MLEWVRLKNVGAGVGRLELFQCKWQKKLGCDTTSRINCSRDRKWWWLGNGLAKTADTQKCCPLYLLTILQWRNGTMLRIRTWTWEWLAIRKLGEIRFSNMMFMNLSQYYNAQTTGYNCVPVACRIMVASLISYNQATILFLQCKTNIIWQRIYN